MKNLPFISLLLILLLGIGCDKSEQLNATIETLEAVDITAYSAELQAKIESDGSLPILTRGFSLSLEPNPTISDYFNSIEGGSGVFNTKASHLKAGMTYYVRAFYTNEKDTVYGNEVEFTTRDYINFNPDLIYGTVSDVDGNVYKTIKIGEQTWMAENLRTTRYQNGDPIDHVTDTQQWGPNQDNGAYIFYDNDSRNKVVHGALYNWNAAIDQRNIAPEGWRVPSVEDWQKLINHLDPYNHNQYGQSLRETTTAHWFHNPDDIATNSTGFTAIPSGLIALGKFWYMGSSCNYRTSTGTFDGSSVVHLQSTISIAEMVQHSRGYSIRCVKEE